MKTATLIKTDNNQLVSLFKKVLYSKAIDEILNEAHQEKILIEIEILLIQGFLEGSREAEETLHQILYTLYLGNFARPWEHEALNIQHPFIVKVRSIIEQNWEQQELKKHNQILSQLPSLEEFPKWSLEYIGTHPCNVTHPFFDFLRDEATYDQFKEFFYQETPVDIFFVDILSLMMVGVYGSMKIEFASNFWEEMGRGNELRVHRNLRLQMNNFLGITGNAYLHQIETFCLEELKLVNTFFDGVFNRQKLLQAIGMMFATETASPGRVERQLEGCQRVGVPDEGLIYLKEHTMADIEHGQGWLNHIVLPLIREFPQAMPSLVLGVLRRLSAAEAVCDHMLVHLKALNQQ
ncbi:MAG: iron-containing redox enzyme family protein [Symploca sp. SIO2D2]|nr:iron-containing redox enzyme family protein [Symploca sp. SIO2D2]